MTGVDEMVISLAVKGLTTGEVQAHPAEAHGADVSHQTISTITGKVLDGMAEWQNRPLDAGRFPAVVANHLVNGSARDSRNLSDRQAAETVRCRIDSTQ